MKTRFLLTPAFFAGTLLITSSAFAANEPNHAAPQKTAAAANAGKLIPVGEKDAAWAAQARKSYPLEVCVTSDEKLGSMGKSPEYIYRAEGKPDRLVVFCCDGCEEDFLKDPAKYLAKIDAAAKAKSSPAPKADAPKGHGEHKH
jgi:hypothetical protein